MQATTTSHSEQPAWAYPEAEEALVGSMLCNPELIEQARHMVSPEMVTHAGLRVIYRACLDLSAIGETGGGEFGAIIPLVVSKLRSEGNLTKAIGHEVSDPRVYLAWISDAGFMSVPIHHLARPILEAWQYREIEDAAHHLGNGGASISEKVEDVKRRLDDVLSHTAMAGTFKASDAFTALALELEAPPPEKSRIRTYTDLDNFMGDLPMGFVTTVGAGSSNGKSTLCMQTAYRNAAVGNPALVLSFEEVPKDISGRLACSIASLDSNKLFRDRGRTMTADDWDKLSRAASRIGELPLYMPEFKAHPSFAEIRAHVEHHVRMRGIRLVVVDHLSLIEAPGREEKDRQSARIQFLAALAKDFNLPFLVAAQINREGRKAIRPAMYHLEGSSAIEQNSQNIVLLHSEESDENPDRSKLEGIIAKARYGETKTVYLRWELPFFRIDNAYWRQAVANLNTGE